jgi:WD40 repeat protein
MGKGKLYTAAFAPDGKTLAAATWEEEDRPGESVSTRLWDVATGRELWRSRGWPTVRALAFSPDGKILAVGDDEDCIRLLDAATGKELSEDSSPRGNVWSIAFSPDGKFVATTGTDRVIHIWDVARGTAKRRTEGHQHYWLWHEVMQQIQGACLANHCRIF